MTTNIFHQEKPWQNALYETKDKLEFLYNTGYISDLTITFPGTDVKFKAHKVILAMSSSIFERMLFGPMAITGSELELPDDNPEAFKIILAHCYEVRFESPDDLDLALDTYMLGDKYDLEDFLDDYRYTIGHLLNNDNIYQILEFAYNFNFNSLKETCYEIFGDRYESRYESNEFDIADTSKALLCLRPEWLKELLQENFIISELIFEKSWYYPDEILCENNILQVLQSENCRNKGLEKFAGCVTAKVVENICNVSYKDDGNTFKDLYLSFTNLQQANECLSILENVEYRLILHIHLQCNKILADGLRHISIEKMTPLLNPWNFPQLCLSDVDDDGIDWVVSAVQSLKPLFSCISFPRSNLTFNGLKSLLTQLAMVFGDIGVPDIQVSSLKIHSDIDGSYRDKNVELEEWIKTNPLKMNARIKSSIRLFELDKKMLGWTL